MRINLFGWIDVLLVSDPQQIHWLNEHPQVTRPLDPSAGILQRLLGARLADLSFDGKPLPVFLARQDAARAERQSKLLDALDELRGLPGSERDEFVRFIAGKSSAAEIGVQVQQWCGRLFGGGYRADDASYRAGRTIAEWPTSPPWHTFLMRVTGRLAAAKKLLADKAEGDVYCVHSTSIGMENIARTLRKLRRTAHDTTGRTLSPDDALRQCLTAPVAVLRGCAGDIEAPFLDRPLTRRTLIVFLVAHAFSASGDLEVAFLSRDWSACPAREVVPEMLRSVWYAAREQERATPASVLGINGFRRIWHRANP